MALTFWGWRESIALSGSRRNFLRRIGGFNRTDSKQTFNTQRKSKMNRITKIIGAAALVAVVTTSAALAQGHGQPDGTGLPLVITLTATATVQTNDTSSSNAKTGTLTSKTTTFKFTQADIIATVEGAHSAVPTKSAVLQITPVTIEVVDGTNHYDATPFVTLTFEQDGNSIWTGTTSTNIANGDLVEKYTGKYISGFDFERGNGDFISVGGLATEIYSIAAVSKTGGKAATDTVSTTFAGEGKKGGAKAIVTGVLKATGKGTLQ
jgi:hypothetical protein